MTRYLLSDHQGRLVGTVEATEGNAVLIAMAAKSEDLHLLTWTTLQTVEPGEKARPEPTIDEHDALARLLTDAAADAHLAFTGNDDAVRWDEMSPHARRIWHAVATAALARGAR